MKSVENVIYGEKYETMSNYLDWTLKEGKLVHVTVKEVHPHGNQKKIFFETDDGHILLHYVGGTFEIKEGEERFLENGGKNKEGYPIINLLYPITNELPFDSNETAGEFEIEQYPWKTRKEESNKNRFPSKSSLEISYVSKTFKIPSEVYDLITRMDEYYSGNCYPRDVVGASILLFASQDDEINRLISEYLEKYPNSR